MAEMISISAWSSKLETGRKGRWLQLDLGERNPKSIMDELYTFFGELNILKVLCETWHFLVWSWGDLRIESGCEDQKRMISTRPDNSFVKHNTEAQGRTKDE